MLYGCFESTERMKFRFIFSLASVVAAGVIGLSFLPSAREPEVAGVQDATIAVPDEVGTILPTLPEAQAVEPLPAFGWPMDRADERVTKKPFGLKIEPGHSPVENDRFTGYHVGVDFETFADEQDIDIPVYVICDGPLVLKQFAKGYGGLAVQTCDLEGQPVSIIYGHLDLTSIAAQPNDLLERGQVIGQLGQGLSPETDGVRKHLHLGVYAGEKLDIRGYVQEELDTKNWLDPLAYMEN
jgi:murein DD-endopeptidase MepM/ murein hydrolase activator NlpD